MRFASSQVLVTCEHASNCLPPAYGTLGVNSADLSSHVAWDIGAAKLARTLTERLDCTSVVGRYSRLLIDLNRSESSPTLIVTRSHGVEIPGNRDLDSSERRHRIDTYHRPYNAEVERCVRERIATWGSCLHLSVHSFTPSLDGTNHRNCDVGVLYHPQRTQEHRIAELLRRELGRTSLRVRRNYPYRGSLDGVQTRMKKMLEDGAYIGIQFEVVETVYADDIRWKKIADALAAALFHIVTPTNGR